MAMSTERGSEPRDVTAINQLLRASASQPDTRATFKNTAPVTAETATNDQAVTMPHPNTITTVAPGAKSLPGAKSPADAKSLLGVKNPAGAKNPAGTKNPAGAKNPAAEKSLAHAILGSIGIMRMPTTLIATTVAVVATATAGKEGMSANPPGIPTLAPGET
ncbi:hypothetical protein LPJ66_005631 [Kickxella alabastrina]|uniref:Uncharacterized protein n=1 Tax=Kickxella alabastrina TaxID=61397 RepID=A0ACC1IIB4_9FUNG|nr:hypothetical protein LPJ66_005631 [Kickxella alabastrina]